MVIIMEHKLLQDVGDILSQYNQHEVENKAEYNIFKVLDICSKEVLMCRMLADLLNPYGTHNRGGVYLEKFFDVILPDMKIDEKMLSNMRVYKEYPIENNRRIDIVICNKHLFLPIEVKINAGEQESQCCDYYNYAVKIQSDTKIIYLTKFGTPPGEYSVGRGIHTLSGDKIRCISFKQDIVNWLDCLIETESGHMKGILQQYKEAIQSFTEDSQRELIENAAEEISSDEEKLRAGLLIAESINHAKAKIIYAVLEEIEKQMEPLVKKYGLAVEQEHRWYYYKDKATEKFYNGYSTFPGINYVIPHAKFEDDISMWFRIEIENNLFAGFCLFHNNMAAEQSKESAKGIGSELTEIGEELLRQARKYLKADELNDSYWWLLWKYLPTGTADKMMMEDGVPDFKYMNSKAISLADKEKRKEFVTECIDVIETELLALIQ